ncbi:triphosphoribosyl-dephospho-CoA synthase [Ruminococcaceae bacterium OttesenSCG-928-D13]|nr:triphosphoribosyl-dephospho-CoA synthase [Ruminococcaceae bacterium OttesenSCG-928-D13]
MYQPGLVDRCNNGAHTDMDLLTFVNSSCALIPYFRDITRRAQMFTGRPEHLLETVRPLGVMAEEAMLASTGGVNTHKGLIYSMGILCAALGYLHRSEPEPDAERVFSMCASIAGTATMAPENASNQPKSNGQAVFEKHHIPGIRGEAAQGFPNVRKHSLPVMQKMMQQGCSMNDAGVTALLHLIAYVDDTNMIHRSSLARSREIQVMMREHLAEPHDAAGLRLLAGQLDAQFIAEHLSPGGSADLLAITFMMYFLQEETSV